MDKPAVPVSADYPGVTALSAYYDIEAQSMDNPDCSPLSMTIEKKFSRIPPGRIKMVPLFRGVASAPETPG